MENKKSEIEARRKEMLKQITKKHDEIYKEKTTKDITYREKIEEIISYVTQYGKLSDDNYTSYIETLNTLEYALTLNSNDSYLAEVIVDKLYRRFEMLREAYEGPSEIYSALARMLNDEQFVNVRKK